MHPLTDRGTIVGDTMHDSEISPYSRTRVSLLNFGFYFAFGFAVPYFTLYLSRILVFEDGRTANHLVGIVLLVFNGLVLLSTPLAGYVSDRFRIGSRVLTMCAAGVAVGAAILALPGFFGALSFANTVTITFIGTAIAGFCLHPIAPLIDSQTLHHLHQTRGQAGEYGQIRLLGSVGFIISTVLIAVILSRTGQIAWTFTLFAAGFVGVAAVSGSGARMRAEPVRIPWRHLKENVRFRRFLAFAFFESLGVNSAFLFTGYFLDEIGAGFVIMGLTFAASVAPEIPVMFNGGVLIRRIGAPRMIQLGIAVQALKLALFVVFAATPSTWIFAAVSLLHGVGFALLYTGGVSFVDDASHPAMRATYQNLYRMLWVSAVAAGGPISGAIIELWNTTALMATYSIMLVLAGVYFTLFVAAPAAAPKRGD